MNTHLFLSNFSWLLSPAHTILVHSLAIFRMFWREIFQQHTYFISSRQSLAIFRNFGERFPSTHTLYSSTRLADPNTPANSTTFIIVLFLPLLLAINHLYISRMTHIHKIFHIQRYQSMLLYHIIRKHKTDCMINKTYIAFCPLKR